MILNCLLSLNILFMQISFNQCVPLLKCGVTDWVTDIIAAVAYVIEVPHILSGVSVGLSVEVRLEQNRGPIKLPAAPSGVALHVGARPGSLCSASKSPCCTPVV